MTAQKKFKIKKGDKVIVTTGRDKGKTGDVLKIMTEEDRVMVKGINLRKKHRKPSQTSPGGIEEIETPIHISNLSVVDPKTDKATRIGYKTLKDGKKVRIAIRSGETID